MKSQKSRLIVSLLVFMACTEVSMGLFDFMKVCLFSEVSGVVTKEGKPVSGAKIVRSAELNDKTFTDTTTTDQQGRYHFKAQFTKSVNAILPVEPFIYQKIFIHHDGQQYRGWEVDKRNYDVNGEIKKAIRLTCDLKDSDETKWFGPRAIKGICKIN